MREAGEGAIKAAAGRPEPGQRSSGLFSHLFPTARGTSEGFPCNWSRHSGVSQGRGVLEGGGTARARRRALQRARVTHACDRGPRPRGGPSVASRGRSRSSVTGQVGAACDTRGRPRRADDTAAGEAAVTGRPQAGPAAGLHPAGGDCDPSQSLLLPFLAQSNLTLMAGS